ILLDGAPSTADSVRAFDPGAAPHIVGVRQIPESDPLMRGRVVAVLYDRDVDPASLSPDSGATPFTLAYAEGQGDDARGPTGDELKRLRLLSSNRIALLNFFSSVSRFYSYTLASSGAHAPSGAAQQPATDTRAVVRDFSEPVGGVVSGYVRNGTGDPIANAP